MRVICIETAIKGNLPKVVKGKVYTVVESLKDKGDDYYVLIENGNRYGYMQSLFLPIPDDNIDEKEIAEQREKLILIK